MNVNKIATGFVVALMVVYSRGAVAEEPPSRSGSHFFRSVFKGRAKDRALTASREELSSCLSNQEISDSTKADAIVAASAGSVITQDEQGVILDIIKSHHSTPSLRSTGIMCLAMCCEESSVADGRDIYEELTIVAQRDSDLEVRIEACQILIVLNRSPSVMSVWVSTTLSAQNSNKMLAKCLDALTGCVRPGGPLTWEDVVLWMRTLADHRAASPSTRERILRRAYLLSDLMEETHGVLHSQLHGFAESMLDPGVTTMEGKENAILIMSPTLPVSSEALSIIREISVDPGVPGETRNVATEYLLERGKDAIGQ